MRRKKHANPVPKPEMLCLGRLVAFSPRVKAACPSPSKQRIQAGGRLPPAAAGAHPIINFRCAANNSALPRAMQQPRAIGKMYLQVQI